MLIIEVLDSNYDCADYSDDATYYFETEIKTIVLEGEEEINSNKEYIKAYKI